VTQRGFETRVRELVANHPMLQQITRLMLLARATLLAGSRPYGQPRRPGRPLAPVGEPKQGDDLVVLISEKHPTGYPSG